MECICDYRHKTTFKSIECNNESIFTDIGWLSYKDNSLRVNSKCPLNYCWKQKTFMSLEYPETQCANNCGGMLCGGCLYR